MAAGDLTTLEAVRAYLRGSVPVPQDDETLLEGLVTAVSKLFVSETGQAVLTQEYTDTWNGEGETKVFLEEYPVLSVTRLTVDGVAVPARTIVGGSGWVMSDADVGRVELVGYTFSPGVANCVVVYSSGLGATAPADIAQAVIDQVAFLYKSKERIGIANESTQAGGSVGYLGAWSAQQGKAGMTPLFAATVDRYRRVA
jgi:hypothetical protein